MMTASPWTSVLDLLVQRGVQIRTGLSSDEIERVERRFAFRYPEDLSSFLKEALPVSHGFPDWRDGEEAALRGSMAWPFEGIAYDIEHNDFWWSAWPSKPERLSDAIELARLEIARAPRLIPVCGHRYLPDEPFTAGNPVFSVYQTDVIYYGRDLETYLACEFGKLSHTEAVTGIERRIPFWTDLVETEW
jgi:hypothetical protein